MNITDEMIEAGAFAAMVSNGCGVTIDGARMLCCDERVPEADREELCACKDDFLAGLKAAIAAAPQMVSVPVAYAHPDFITDMQENNTSDIHQFSREPDGEWNVPLYTSPPTPRRVVMTKTRKLAIRRRLADYAAHVDEHGTINRSDVMRIGEVSRPQASADIRMLIADYPALGLTYDKSAKTYVAVRGK